jgi:xanthine dehydrogenase accessory factor
MTTGIEERSDDVLEVASTWRAAGQRVAWAAVVRTWGSSPRPAGSRLVVSGTGEFFGSVSGGCVEGAVVTEATAILAGGAPKLLHFGVTDEEAWEVGLACGGQIDVYVEEIPALFEPLLAERRAQRPVVLATRLQEGGGLLLDREALAHPPDAEVEELAGPARQALRADACAVVESARGPVFLEPHNPPLRLAVVGAVHVALPLCRLAAIAGFAVTVIDPRTAFTLPGHLLGLVRSSEWPDAALARLQPDARTAVVTLTHDPKLDDPALVAALGSEAFYIGCLGSKKTHAGRLRRLVERGFDEAALARLHGPVGLPIGARTPQEIAVSILAQVIATLRSRTSSEVSP